MTRLEDEPDINTKCYQCRDKLLRGLYVEGMPMADPLVSKHRGRTAVNLYANHDPPFHHRSR